MIGGWWDSLVQAAGGDGRRRPVPRDPRELYHSFLQLASDIGRPKKEEQTPKEHQKVLGWSLPPEPVAHIVDGFQEVYYGRSVAADQRMPELVQDWSTLLQFVADRSKPNSPTGPDPPTVPDPQAD
jgi:hypothetical protein